MEEDFVFEILVECREVIKLSGGENNRKYKLYVLRYNFSGNYYVGITENPKKRMLIHWRRESKSKRLPKWSSLNVSKRGFKFYWFDIDKDVVSQSCADRCENRLAKRLVEEIKNVNDGKSIEEIHVGNGKFVDGIPNNYGEKTTVDNSIKRDIDKKIEVFLKSPILLNLEKVNEKILIRNIEIGNIGEYDISQCNKKWDDVVEGN